MTRLGLFFVVLLSVSAGLFLLAQTDSASKAEDFTGRNEVSVVLTDRGFRPEVIYVTKGTVVNFSATIGTHYWPASDLHPFHSIYPAFDPKRPLAKDETWSFRFEKEGAWSYHDHLHLDTGKIFVLAEGEDAGDAVHAQPCTQEHVSERRACWKQQLQREITTNGLGPALDSLLSLYEADDSLADSCHLYAHDLGLIAYSVHGTLPPLSERAQFCGQGFYHGYMEAFLVAHEGDFTEATEFCRSVARYLDSRAPNAGPQCFHGMGHGYMEYLLQTRPDKLNDLPGLLRIGSDMCSSLSNYDEKFRCTSGTYAVFKDWIFPQPDFRGLVSLDDPFSLCLRESEAWGQEACAWELAKQVLLLTMLGTSGTISKPMDPAQAFAIELRTGARLADGRYLGTMVESTAFLVGEKLVSRDDAWLLSTCRSIPSDDLALACIRGITKGLIFSGLPRKEAVRTVRFCLQSGTTVAEQVECGRAVVVSLYDMYGIQERDRSCMLLAAAPWVSSLCAEGRPRTI